MLLDIPVFGNFSAGFTAGMDATASVVLIPPSTHQTGVLYSGKKARGRMRITKVCYSTGDTAHVIGIMRPFNYTTFSADAVAAQAVVNITADPGLYSTAANWLYPSIPGGAPRIADNAIAASDFVVYQCADGTWVADTVSSVATLAITLSNNVPTGGVKAGGLFYFFGVMADSDPNTAAVNPQTTIAASVSRDASWADPAGVVAVLHDGDPLLFYSPHTIHLGQLEFLDGLYCNW